MATITRVPAMPTVRAGGVKRAPQPFTGAYVPFRSCLTRVAVRCRAEEDPRGGDGGLSGVFNQFVLLKGIKSPAAVAQQPNPSPLVPPTAVLEQAMSLLQRNDWPEPDVGVRAAFNLTLPATEEGQELGSVRSWRAAEEWLSWPRFHAMLHVAYNPLINCDSWRPVSPLVFPSERHDNKAVQAVEVRARPRHGAGPGQQPQQQQEGPETALRSYTYTFCWERATSGAYKDCWLIAGVRVGNYAL